MMAACQRNLLIDYPILKTVRLMCAAASYLLFLVHGVRRYG